MQGQLFTQDFLEQGITETEQWRSLDEEAFKGFVDRLRSAFSSFAGIKDPNEATTERQLIDPILKALGWDHFLPQQSAAKHRSDVPDYLLFENADTEPMRRFLDFRHSLRWLGHNNLNKRATPIELLAILDGSFGDPFRVIDGEIELVNGEDVAADTRELFPEAKPTQLDLARQSPVDRETRQKAKAMMGEAGRIAAHERFLHWQVAFPGVWQNWESLEPRGGFDAVIGNPPWDRIKLQEVEWFAARRPDIARAARASDRKRMIETLRESDDPLWIEHAAAKKVAEHAADVARRSGDFPLLSTGDINIYALFVERAHQLIKPNGLVGLLLPSGLASDKSSSTFFKFVTEQRHLSTLLNFENRGQFFGDVHHEQKFIVYVAGGLRRHFASIWCGFFLTQISDLADSSRTYQMTPAELAAINPNTGTAPVFRTRRDADLVAQIYSRCSILVDRRSDTPAYAWPVRYYTMFHMTNDSILFKTADELAAEGAYPVTGHRWRHGKRV